MDRLRFNQARKFLSKHTIIIQNIFGEERAYDLYSFFQTQIAQGKVAIWPELQVLIADQGEVFKLLLALPSHEKSAFPYSFDLHQYANDRTVYSRFFLYQSTRSALEIFLDQLSCFVALYYTDLEEALSTDYLLLSKSTKHAGG